VSEPSSAKVPYRTIVREWGRLGFVGFGGPPTHIALLRRLCVDQRGWIDAREFEDGIATVNLLPGPASTQLAIYCAWRLRGALGGLLGGLCFITPGLVIITALAALFLEHHPPLWVLGAAAGSGAAVPAVALHAASRLAASSPLRSEARRSPVPSARRSRAPSSWSRCSPAAHSRSYGAPKVAVRDRLGPRRPWPCTSPASAGWARWRGWPSRSAPSPTAGAS
jgi:chromate transport protein ChrA